VRGGGVADALEKLERVWVPVEGQERDVLPGARPELLARADIFVHNLGWASSIVLDSDGRRSPSADSA